VDGSRHSRSLTRQLAIFETYCTRTGLLKYSEIDLRVMREGAPKNGERIMGYTLRRKPNYEWQEVPGVRVSISGPTGETIVTSDQQSLYDIPGLPPGPYVVHGMDQKAGPYWAYPVCLWEGRQSLKSGDVRDCGLTVPD